MHQDYFLKCRLMNRILTMKPRQRAGPRPRQLALAQPTICRALAFLTKGAIPLTATLQAKL